MEDIFLLFEVQLYLLIVLLLVLQLLTKEFEFDFLRKFSFVISWNRFEGNFGFDFIAEFLFEFINFIFSQRSNGLLKLFKFILMNINREGKIFETI